jgi:hypothetical protein
LGFSPKSFLPILKDVAMEQERMWQWSIKGCGNGAGKDGAMEQERMWQWSMKGWGNGA